MKIIVDNAVYVQKKEVINLSKLNITIPPSLHTKVFCSGVIIIENYSEIDFIKFDEPEEIEFFKNIDWIIDYSDVKDLSEEEIIDLGRSIEEERHNIAQKFNSMPLEKREQNANMMTQYELLGFKLQSLKEVLWYKQGHIKIKMPKDNELNQKKGIKKLLNIIFNKRSN